MIDIGTLYHEIISFIYNLVRVSILSVALVGMKCADLESLVVSATNRVSLDPDTSCQNLGRTSNALSIPHKFSALMFSSLIASFCASRICNGNFSKTTKSSYPSGMLRLVAFTLFVLAVGMANFDKSLAFTGSLITFVYALGGLPVEVSFSLISLLVTVSGFLENLGINPFKPSREENFLGTVRFGNDHVAAILGFGDLQWGNILISRVYFVEGLGHNLFSVGQFCDSDLEVAFRRNTCFVRTLEGVDLLKRVEPFNKTFNTINLHDMALHPQFAYMARHLLIFMVMASTALVPPEARKSKRASQHPHTPPPKPVPNSKQRLHLLHMDLCGPYGILHCYNGKCALCYHKIDREVLGNLVQKVILAFLLVILLIPVLTGFTPKDKGKIMEAMDVSFDDVDELDSNKLVRITQNNGDMCIYALTVSTIEPNNVKEAITDPAWIDSMLEELLQFKRLDVWVLVPAPDNIKPLT
ncbi:hypothetical protein Tco_0767956 [Tanacetum coccineum]